MKYKETSIFLFLSFLFFYCPRLVFFDLPGSTSSIRLDTIFFLLLIALSFLISLNKLTSVKVKLLAAVSICVFTFLGFLYIFRGNSPIYATAQLLWYASIIFMFIFSKSYINEGEESTNRVLRFFRIFINLNLMSHFLSWILNLGGIANTSSQISLIYGIFNMPYAFALMIGLYGLIVFSGFLKVSLVEKIALITALFIADSKIVLGGFFISLFFILQFRNKILYLLSIPLVIVFVIPAIVNVDLRSLQFLFYSIDDLIQNPSLNVRLFNFYNYLSWVDIGDYLLGAGPLSYMQYSIQYGEPGPLDVFYLRLLSDFGLIPVLIIVSLFILYCLKNIKVFFRGNNLLISIFIFLFLYSFFNEGLLVIKTGHICAFLIGIVFWKIKSEFENNPNS